MLFEYENKLHKYEKKINNIMIGGNYKNIFNTIYKETGLLDIAINTVLVIGNIRRGFLIQAIDYNEKIKDNYDEEIKNINSTTGKILRSLLKKDLGLKIIYHNQGIFILNKNIEKSYIDNIDTAEGQGKLISYPCAGDLYLEKKYNYLIEIEYNNDKKTIMSVICSKDNDEEFSGLKEQIQIFLQDKIDEKIQVTLIKIKILTIDNVIEFIENEEKMKTKLSSEELDNFYSRIFTFIFNFTFYFIELIKNDKIDILGKDKNLLMPLILYIKMIIDNNIDPFEENMRKFEKYLLEVNKIKI
jgi:hypothetical protein